MLSPTPHFKKNSIPVVFCIDENYVKYLAVSIASLIANSTQDNNYEIYILVEELKHISITNLKNLTKGKRNFAIKVINIKEIIASLGRELFYESKHIKISAYYRLFIPEIFKNFDKILYLDADLVVLEDIAEIFKYDISNHPVGVVEDLPVKMLKEIGDKSSVIRNKYNKEVLGILEHERHFNSGVMLFNITILKEGYLSTITKALKTIKNPEYWDQDILNYLYAREAFYLDAEWNTQLINVDINKINLFNNSSSYKIYLECLENPKILHFIAPIKPWYNPFFPQSSYFWQYAKLTPYYETMLIKIVTEFNLYNLWCNKLAYISYKFLSYFIFGKLRESIKMKIIAKRNMLREIKHFLKNAKLI